MRARVPITLFIIQIIIGFIVIQFQSSSGFMDSDYYYSGGIQITRGKIGIEPFIWNYLDNPSGLPHPSYTYWMPLASIVASLGMLVFNNTGYFFARLLFIILAGFIPVLSSWLTWKLTKSEKIAWFTGFLGICGGFYIIYYAITETITLYMIIGTLIIALLFIKLDETERTLSRIFIWLFGGLLSGLMHLARADGLIWFIAVLGYSIWWSIKNKTSNKIERYFAPVLIFVGYFFMMSFWMLRNIRFFGSLFPPGGLQTIWLTEYDQLFSYPASSINIKSWISLGAAGILKNIGQAVILNLQTSIAVQGTIILLPLIVIGIIYLRKNRIVHFVLALWLFTFLAMTLIFPFSGSRGGFLHSGSAFQPVFWVIAGVGLERFIDWGHKKRNWDPKSAFRVFSVAIITICALITAYVFFQKIIGLSFSNPSWNAEHTEYTKVENELKLLGAKPDDIVMVKNPPGYFVVNNRSAIVIPYGPIDGVYDAGNKYHAKYLLIDHDHTKALDDFYNNKESNNHFRFLVQVGNFEIFEIIKPGD